jgi:hypothetical protein
MKHCESRMSVERGEPPENWHFEDEEQAVAPVMDIREERAMVGDHDRALRRSLKRRAPSSTRLPVVWPPLSPQSLCALEFSGQTEPNAPPACSASLSAGRRPTPHIASRSYDIPLDRRACSHLLTIARALENNKVVMFAVQHVSGKGKTTKRSNFVDRRPTWTLVATAAIFGATMVS